MIRKSFQILPGIGKEKELMLYKKGIDTWDKFFQCKKIPGISYQRKKYFDRKLQELEQHLYRCDVKYLAKNIPTAEHWRLYPFFKEEVVYLDIETSGARGYPTIICLFDGIETKTLVRGINLDARLFFGELQKYNMIVSFNGRVFDIPFLTKYFGRTELPPLHMDLRTVCRRIGFSGGLKEVERIMGIERGRIVSQFHGGDPYTLWKMWRATGDEYYLNLLIEYNEDDTIHLKKIAEYAVAKLSAKIFPISELTQKINKV